MIVLRMLSSQLHPPFHSTHMPHKLDTIPIPHADDATEEAQSLVQLRLAKQNQKRTLSSAGAPAAYRKQINAHCSICYTASSALNDLSRTLR